MSDPSDGGRVCLNSPVPSTLVVPESGNEPFEYPIPPGFRLESRLETKQDKATPAAGEHGILDKANGMAGLIAHVSSGIASRAARAERLDRIMRAAR